MTKHYTYIIQAFESKEDEGWVAAVVNLSTPDENVYVSAIGNDKYKAIAEVGEALKSWEEANEIGQSISRQEAITIANKILSDAEAERLVDND